MDFSNELVYIEHIPDVAQARFEALEANYLKVKRIVFFILLFLAVLGAVLSFVFIAKIRIWWVMLAVFLGIGILFLMYWIADSISFRFSGYALREHDVMFRSGWWWRTLRLVPFNRVQHISIESGLIERQYGLASIRIYTAGSGQADFTLHGITEQTAQKLKDWISTKIQETPSHDSSTETDADA